MGLIDNSGIFEKYGGVPAAPEKTAPVVSASPAAAGIQPRSVSEPTPFNFTAEEYGKPAPEAAPAASAPAVYDAAKNEAGTYDVKKAQEPLVDKSGIFQQYGAPPPPAPESITAKDVGLSLMSGAANVPTTIAEGAKFVSDRLGLKDIAKAAGDWRNTFQDYEKYWQEGMSPAGKEALAGGLKGHPFGTILLNAAQSAPGMIAMAGPAGLIAKGLEGGAVAARVAGDLAAKGVPETVAAAAGAAHSARVGGVTGELVAKALTNLGVGAERAGRIGSWAPGAIGAGASEGIFSALQNGAQTAQEVLDPTQTPDATLMQHPVAKTALDATDPALPMAERIKQVRNAMANAAESQVILRTVPWTAITGMFAGGGVLGQITRPSAGILKGIAKGAASEAAQEFTQSYGEQVIQNLAAKNYYEENRDPLKDALSQAIIGAGAGGLLGGVGGGLHGLVKPAGEPPEAVPAEPGQITPPATAAPQAGPLEKAAGVPEPVSPIAATGALIGAASVARGSGVADLKFAFSNPELAQKVATTRTERGQPSKVVPHQTVEGSHAVIQDYLTSAGTDEERIAALQRENTTLIDRIKPGQAQSASSIAHVEKNAGEIEKLRAGIAAEAEKEAAKPEKAAARADKEFQDFVKSEGRDKQVMLAEQQVERAKQAELDAIQAGTAPNTPQPTTSMGIALKAATDRQIEQAKAATDQAVANAERIKAESEAAARARWLAKKAEREAKVKRDRTAESIALPVSVTPVGETANLGGEISKPPVVSPITHQPAAVGIDETSPGGQPITPQTTVDQAAHEAATSPQNELPEPTPAEREAGNYPKGHITVSGLDISVENPEGSIRRSQPGAPQAWQQTMKAHYGYIKGVPARAPDKEHVDVFVRPGTTPDNTQMVHIIDQNHANGKFDEPKVMLGYKDEKVAKAAYLAHYPKGQESRIRNVTSMSMERFKERLQMPEAFLKPQSEQAVFKSQPGFKPAAPKGKPLSEITVKRQVIEMQDGEPTGRKVPPIDEKADVALKDVDDQLSKARMLLECLHA